MTTLLKLQQLVNDSRYNLHSFLSDLLEKGYCGPSKDYKSYGSKSYIFEVTKALESADISYSFGYGQKQVVGGDGCFVAISSSFNRNLSQEDRTICNHLYHIGKKARKITYPEIRDYAEELISMEPLSEYRHGFSYVVIDKEIKACIDGPLSKIEKNGRELYGMESKIYKALSELIVEKFGRPDYSLVKQDHIFAAIRKSENNMRYLDFEGHLKADFASYLNYWRIDKIQIGNVLFEKGFITNPAQNEGKPFDLKRSNRYHTWVSAAGHYLWPLVKKAGSFTRNGEKYLIGDTCITKAESGGNT